MSDIAKITECLGQINWPGETASLTEKGCVGEVEIDGEEVVIELNLSGLSREDRHALEDKVVQTVGELDGVAEVILDVESEDVAVPEAPSRPAAEPGLTMNSGKSAAPVPSEPAVKPKTSALGKVKNLIGVASGKGGVGKSTVAANLALALQAKGAKVGLCDIDIYGPSIPIQMGVVDAKPTVSPDHKKFVPVDAYGVKVMSIGFLVDDDTPVIWRGPIVSSVVKQFLEDVVWGELDYLVIDMPPGTGDAQLTLSQTAPLTGAVIVTTPSELALVDAQKGLQMFRKVEIPVLGLVENMSYYVCGSCGDKSEPFSSGGTTRLSEQYNVEVLAALPLDHTIQRGSDNGTPVVSSAPESPQAQAFLGLADALIKKCPFEQTEKKGMLSGLFGR
jgi:ATP-binding protein involved in chromosome partitioning